MITNRDPGDETDYLPAHVERAIAEVEDELTEKVREETGRDDIHVVFDRSPIRKWPDDFRGFGSNVQPKGRR